MKVLFKKPHPPKPSRVELYFRRDRIHIQKNKEKKIRSRIFSRDLDFFSPYIMSDDNEIIDLEFPLHVRKMVFDGNITKFEDSINYKLIPGKSYKDESYYESVDFKGPGDVSEIDLEKCPIDDCSSGDDDEASTEEIFNRDFCSETEDDIESEVDLGSEDEPTEEIYDSKYYRPETEPEEEFTE